jgi:CHAD domain-containing protein
MRIADDSSFQALAAQFLRKQIKQLAAQDEGIREGIDLEFVHRARVATRRLRAGLKFFDECFDARSGKRWRREIRRLTRELGDARDKDVQIEYVRGALAEIHQPQYVPGIARLLVTFEHQRESAQVRVLKALDRFRASRTAEEIAAAIKPMTVRESAGPSECVLKRAEEQIVAGVDDLLSYETSLADAADQQQHHAMRIAAKRLRYAMEICRGAYADRLDPFLASVKEIQGLLGEIHDRDVWGAQLDALLADQRDLLDSTYGHDKPLERIKPGIEHLRQERARDRDRLFDQLAGYWQKLRKENLWENLVQAVRSRKPPPSPPADKDNSSAKKDNSPAEHGKSPAERGNGHVSQAKAADVRGKPATKQ